MLGGRQILKDIKVHKATRWTIRHDLMLLWLKELMNVTEQLQLIDPNETSSMQHHGFIVKASLNWNVTQMKMF